MSVSQLTTTCTAASISSMFATVLDVAVLRMFKNKQTSYLWTTSETKVLLSPQALVHLHRSQGTLSQGTEPVRGFFPHTAY